MPVDPATVSEVTDKDVVLAVLGAAAGLGGLILVFLGVVISSYQALDKETMKKVKEPYKKTGCHLLGVFLLSLTAVALAVAWLVSGQPGILYTLTVVAFGLELALVAVVAPITVYKRLLA
jgi:hypothetical protein